MNDKLYLPVFLGYILIQCGCMNGHYARDGAMVGAMIGTPVGAAIGSHNGEPGAGALVGGSLGALTGNWLGANIDNQQRIASVTRAGYGRLSIGEVISMTRSGLGEEVIITQIHNQGMVAIPTSDDLINLKTSGVSDRVIQAMQTDPASNAHQARFIQQPAVEETWCPSLHNPYYMPYHHARFHHHWPPDYGFRRGSSIILRHRF